VVGRGGLDGAGLIGVSYWAPPDLALLYLDTAAEIEPSAITLYDYLHCIQEAGRAYRIDLVQNFAKSAITLAPEARSQIARYIYSAAIYSGATTVETLNKAASMLELALQIDPASADEIAGSYYEDQDYEYGTDFWGRPKKRGYVSGGYLDLANWAAQAGLPDLAEQYLNRALEIARNKKATKKGVSIIKWNHGLKRPVT
jgi:tetratricopeptide (TPR) repeat protein